MTRRMDWTDDEMDDGRILGKLHFSSRRALIYVIVKNELGV